MSFMDWVKPFVYFWLGKFRNESGVIVVLDQNVGR